MSPIRIPTLTPWGLDLVPDWEPDTAEFQETYFAWRDRVKEVRVEVQLLCKYGDATHSPRFYQELELELCSQDPARFIALWLYIEEPRIIEGESPVKPFVPFPFQVELAQWWVERTGQAGAYDGFISKARGLGATWILCACATWAWLFRPWRGTLISRKEDLVDKPRDVNSMFGKIDFVLDHLPEWMLPEGFDPKEHRMRNFLSNPASVAQIVGEATTAKATRGGRATYVIFDEAAFIPAFKDVFGTASGTTNHRWAVSSESFEEGDDWWNTWTTAKERDPGCVRELGWELNPYNDAHWFAQEQIRWEHDPEGFAREYLRDPFAGFGAWVYPTVRKAQFTEQGFDPKEVLLVGIDPGRADDTAIVFMQFSGDDYPRTARWIDSYTNNLQPAEYYAHILTGIYPRPGDKCYGAHFDQEADHIMAWMASLPWSGAMRVFCDPAGSQKDMSGLSFTDRLTLESKRLRARDLDERIAEGRITSADDAPRLVPIVPLYEELFSANRHDQRRLAMRELLMRSVFTANRGGRRLQNAFAKYRFSEPGDKSTSQPSPLHDEHSHLVSAAEYVAVYCSMGLGTIKARRDREKTKRIPDPLTGSMKATTAA